MIIRPKQETKNNTTFKIYQHCMMSDNAPHTIVDEQFVKKSFSKSKAWFVQYTTEFDVPQPTTWWYCIKDEKYDISTFKAKARYEVNKGRKNFSVSIISPLEYKNEIFDIDIKKFADYPESYRPILASTADEHIKKVVKDGDRWFGLFSKEDSSLVGYAIILEKEEFVNLSVVAIDPSTYKKNSSAGLVDGILCHYQDSDKAVYICDGARNVRHQTNYQDFLISTFEFRKAYCRIRLKYKWWAGIAIFLLRPFKKLLLKSDKSFFYNLGCILRLDEYARLSQK
ncbi:MAG: hypothetical protein K2K85_07085 [Clostridia bacterium]|nr:hypothetical protein [Clostridia bacterium]